MSTSEDRALKQSPTGNSSTANTSESDASSHGQRYPTKADDVWGAIDNDRRREIITLLASERETTTGEIADHLVRLETGGTAYDAGARKERYISSYQHHLPTLDEAGVIDYEGHTVTPGETFDAALEAVDRLHDVDLRDPEPTGLLDRVYAVVGRLA